MAGCREEFSKDALLLYHKEPKLFVTSQWPCHPILYVVYRCVVAVYFFIWLVISGVQFGTRWFLYFTNWSFFILNVSLLHQMSLSIWGYVSLRRDPSELTSMRWFLRVGWLLYNIAGCLSLTVFVVYWALLYTAGDVIDAVNITTHNINSLCVIADLLISAIPLRLLHFIHALPVGVMYMIFNIVYAFLEDDVVYDILDWVDNPGAAAIYSSSLLLVLAPLIWLCMYGLYRIRLAIFNRCFHGRGHASYASFES